MQIHLVPSTYNTQTANKTATSAVSADGRNFDHYLNADSNSLAAYFKEAADTYNVPISLLSAIAMQESCFKADAVSKSGAMGIMQLMPAAANEFGCANPYDPHDNIMAGAKCISRLLNKYNGNTPLALAAYNAGSGNVDKYGGIPPFPETQNYVQKVLHYMNEGVTLPDGTVISPTDDSSGSAESTDASINRILNSLDADALMDLAEVLYSAVNESRNEPVSKKLDVSVTSSNDNYYAYQSIRYNNSVLNLLAPDSDDIQ